MLPEKAANYILRFSESFGTRLQDTIHAFVLVAYRTIASVFDIVCRGHLWQALCSQWLVKILATILARLYRFGRVRDDFL